MDTSRRPFGFGQLVPVLRRVNTLAMVLLKAEEINFLVYRYLQESGHTHSAFTFAYESLVAKSSIARTHADAVPPGALIALIQKGLMYLQVEKSVDDDVSMEDNPSCLHDADFGLLHAVMQLARNKPVKYSTWSAKHDKHRDPADDAIEKTKGLEPRCTTLRLNIPVEPMNEKLSTTWRNATIASADVHATGRSILSPNIDLVCHKRDLLVSPDDVLILTGHEAEVFCCSWHPYDGVLASGSGDSTVRLWNLPEGRTATEFVMKPPTCTVLQYAAPISQNNSATMAQDDHDVTTLEWSPDGTLLATGCMDGVARLWSHDGILQHSLDAHSESIFSLRFDATGTRLLTGSYDKCVSVWDVAAGELQHKFEAHSAQVLDVDWKNGGHNGHDIFASCSTDRTIAICALEDIEAETGAQSTTATPLQVLVGHADEVNAIRWDPAGALLASCSDDHHVLVWQLGQPISVMVEVLTDSLVIGLAQSTASVTMQKRYTQSAGRLLGQLQLCQMHH